MSYEVVYREKYGSDGKDITYVKYPDNDKLFHLKPKVESVHRSLLERLKIFFQEVFLPQGYPESVSEDYWNYQVWDSLQAFCSTLSGTLTTHAIMKGVGVGDTNTTPLSAAITWVLKDGTGMVGRILFAWKKGTSLDADCKKWRLFADFLNDSAMCVEMFLLPVIPKFSTELLCVSTTMKAIVGVAGGATKAATTQHQAIRNNMGDVSAKDGSQETCLNLIGSIFGIFLLSFVAESERLAKLIFVICILLHMYSNYKAVKALNFKTLNKERLLIILKTYFKYYIIENSDRVNNKESVFLGTGIKDQDFCGFQIKMGCSLKHLIDHNLLSNDEFHFYSYGSECCNNSYLVIVNNPLKTIFVPLKPDHNDKDELLAYYHAVLLGIATSISNNFKLKIPLEIDKLSSPLNELMEKLKRNSISDFKNRSKEFIINTGLTSGKEPVKINNISFEEITKLDAIMKKEFEVFLKSLKESGWIIDRHHLPVGEWRANWASDIHSKTI